MNDTIGPEGLKAFTLSMVHETVVVNARRLILFDQLVLEKESKVKFHPAVEYWRSSILSFF